jgi:3-deoxy-D-manno-octulosonic-acid transferase
MIEPCAYGVATCFGPNTRNFSDIVGLLLDADAAVQLAAPDALGPWVVEMFERPERREMLADHARRVTAAHRGAVARTWRALESCLASAKAPRS